MRCSAPSLSLVLLQYICNEGIVARGDPFIVLRSRGISMSNPGHILIGPRLTGVASSSWIKCI